MRKRLFFAALALVAVALPATAQSRRSTAPNPLGSYTVPSYPTPTYEPPTPPTRGRTYDWQSGNMYSWRKDTAGNTKVDGVNLNTGSVWNTTIKPNGSMTGTDSNLNPWSYDNRTKTYVNYGTGKMCVGEGLARTCF